MLHAHKELYGCVQVDILNNEQKYLDILLATLSVYFKEAICLLTPDYIWLTRPIGSFKELDEFGLFFCVCQGKLYNMCRKEYISYRQLQIYEDSIRDSDEDEGSDSEPISDGDDSSPSDLDDYFAWRNDPATGKCEFFSLTI